MKDIQFTVALGLSYGMRYSIFHHGDLEYTHRTKCSNRWYVVERPHDSDVINTCRSEILLVYNTNIMTVVREEPKGSSMLLSKSLVE
jgi:hypothetical protein